MTNAPTRCAGCDWPLTPDDRFCSRCGTSAPGDDDGATIVDNPASLGRHVERGPASGGPPPPDAQVATSGTAFRGRFQAVLGDEYEILSFIGKGGFARVYKAIDHRLDRIVAIKVIRPDVVGTELFWESFRTEGIALAKLRHPGIIPIYDIHERGGLIYYIMPFVKGTSLDARLERSRLPPYESRRILSELTDALEAAHRAKMVHLDIKPDNVFLEGDLQKVLLMDFGIAMALSEEVGESSSAPVVGTPDYMSPEQAQGLPEIDHRSDIYSVGVLGYRMLMGRPPFSGRDGTEILEKHVSQAPADIRNINPTIPKDFADAIMKCLAKDPWERFSTAKELGAALDAVTFFATRGETAPAEKSSGMPGSLVGLIAGGALLVGLVLGLLIG